MPKMIQINCMAMQSWRSTSRQKDYHTGTDTSTQQKVQLSSIPRSKSLGTTSPIMVSDLPEVTKADRNYRGAVATTMLAQHDTSASHQQIATTHDRSTCEPTISESPCSLESSTSPKESKREVLGIAFVALVDDRPEGVPRGCLGHHDDATGQYVNDILLPRCLLPLTR